MVRRRRLVAEQAARASGTWRSLSHRGARGDREGDRSPRALLRLPSCTAGWGCHASRRAVRALLAAVRTTPWPRRLRTGRVAAGALAVLANWRSRRYAARRGGDPRAKIAAWEELAHVDGELRGDRASAPGPRIDPRARSQPPGGQRALERTLSRERETELAALYAQVAAALVASDGAADAVPLYHLRSRLAERRGETNEALADLRRIAELAPADRAALFRLESRARESGLADEVSRWDDAIAAHFEGDPRAQAAFLTRAGESLVESGRRGVDPAIVRFRAAVSASPGYFPALRAWLRLALVEELGWTSRPCASSRPSRAPDADRAHLYHLAGVTAMIGGRPRARRRRSASRARPRSRTRTRSAACASSW